MLKLYYIIGIDDDCIFAVSYNNETIDNTISVQCTFKTGERFNEAIFMSTGRTIKSLFISMNGIVKLKRYDDKIEIVGSVPVMLKSANKNLEEEEMLFLNREVWELFSDTDEQIKLYRHSNGCSFRMDVTALEDIGEEDNLSAVLGFLYDEK